MELVAELITPTKYEYEMAKGGKGKKPGTAPAVAAPNSGSVLAPLVGLLAIALGAYIYFGK
jgi:hypothetical protein